MEATSSPFQSCPTEIVQIIFEDVACSSDKRLQTSITLSHVCWSWRKTALATPRLWALIVLKLGRPRSVIDSIWDEMTKRAGSVPLVIEIEASQIALHDSLPRNFEHAQSIDSLSLSISTSKTFDESLRLRRLQEFQELTFSIPRCSIRHLTIKYPHFFGHLPSWPLDSWLRKWPSVQSIHILVNAEVHFEHRRPLYSVKSMELSTRGQYSLHDVNTLFPNLDSLVLTGILHRDSSPPVIFPYLKNLRLGGIYAEAAWNTISCPNLITFDHSRTHHPSSFYRFLQVHSSIKCLKIGWEDKDSLSRISESVPGVTSLQLDGVFALNSVDWVGSNASPIFPNLEELVIYDIPMNDTIEKFNSLVIARCLPIQHPDCRRMQGIKKQLRNLVIRILNDRPPSSWISSHLISSVKDMTIIKIKIKDTPNMTRYVLQWNEDEEPHPVA